MDNITPRNLDFEESAVLDWYYANLEYACAADLSLLSLNHWDQDDQHDFTGAHLMLCDGYHSMLEPLTEGLDIRLNVRWLIASLLHERLLTFFSLMSRPKLQAYLTLNEELDLS